jgi:hypothetical protein
MDPGAYRTANPNAAFFLRNEQVLEALPEEFDSRFKDPDAYSQLALTALKVRLSGCEGKCISYVLLLGKTKSSLSKLNLRLLGRAGSN